LTVPAPAGSVGGVTLSPPAVSDDLLLPLHAATEVGELWDAVLPLLRTTLAPCVRVTLFLGHFEMREARLVFTDPPIERAAEWYKERGRLNPFSEYIAAHRRISFYRFSDVVGPRSRFARTEFYRRFARVEGWDKGLSGLFWRGREVKAMFSLYRSPEQPEFADAEIARLHALRPHIETAIDRVQKLQHERLRRKVIEEFSRHIPIGLLLLNWDLHPVFANHQAVHECAVWRHGPGVARGLVSRDRFELPDPVRDACERLRGEILRSNAKDRPSIPRRLERLTHPGWPKSRGRPAWCERGVRGKSAAALGADAERTRDRIAHLRRMFCMDRRHGLQVYGDMGNRCGCRGSPHHPCPNDTSLSCWLRRPERTCGSYAGVFASARRLATSGWSAFERKASRG
jgi:hypothetical protein